ncbi:MAG: organic solvent ABC transporter permease, partial [Sphingomonas sp.]
MTDNPAAEIRADKDGRRTTAPALVADKGEGGLVLTLSGDWLARTIGSIEKTVADTGESDLGKSVTIDLGSVGRVDTAGALLVEKMSRKLSDGGRSVEMSGVREKDGALFEAVRAAIDRVRPEPEVAKRNRVVAALDGIGRSVYGLYDEVVVGLNIIGSSIYGAGRRVTGKTQVRLPAIITQMDRMGVRAVPIIALMSFLIGAVIAQ